MICQIPSLMLKCYIWGLIPVNLESSQWNIFFDERFGFFALSVRLESCGTTSCRILAIRRLLMRVPEGNIPTS